MTKYFFFEPCELAISTHPAHHAVKIACFNSKQKKFEFFFLFPETRKYQNAIFKFWEKTFTIFYLNQLQVNTAMAADVVVISVGKRWNSIVRQMARSEC